MRAVVIHGPRDLRIEPVETPEPGPHQVRVRIGAGGICGSDLHYYLHGGFGVVRLQEPMVLGHEVAGTVEEVGEKVARVRPGSRVAINPSRPCRACRYCLEGHSNQCFDMRFYGSAMRFPHVQGAFREEIVIDETQAVEVDEHVSLSTAAMAEPLSVGLHAIQRAGSVLGARVVVTGCGPIGALLIGSLRRAGAAEIVAVDIAEAPLAYALAMGADRAINIANAPDTLVTYQRDKGYFDYLFEASGSPSALHNALDLVRPRGVIVAVGLGGDISVPMNKVVSKELALRGSFRFDREFEEAVHFLNKRLIDVQPVLTGVLPFHEASAAFELASDRARSMKVQLSFE